MRSFITFIFLFTTFGVLAESDLNYELSAEKLASIESRVDNMSYDDLIKRQNSLRKEKSSLEAALQEGSATSSQSSAGLSRIAEIVAELSAIQKTLAAFAGAALISNLTEFALPAK